MTITPSPTWTKAMQRAIREDLKPTRRVDGAFRVCSISHPGTVHIVTLDGAGHIADCSDCLGWVHGGRAHPCKHAGATALGIAFLEGHSIIPASDDAIYTNHSRQRLYRDAGA